MLTYVTLVFALTLGPWDLALITIVSAFPGTGELTPWQTQIRSWYWPGS